MINLFRRLNKDQRGTALTEFIITVPIFIMVFAGITSIGSVNERSTRTWARAYKATFDSAVGVQRSIGGPHMSAPIGGALALSHIATAPQEMGGIQRAMFTLSDGYAFGSLLFRGTLGEQHGRVRPTDFAFELNARQGSGNDDRILGVEFGDSNLLTNDIDDIVGNSTYAKDIYDDSVSTSGFSGGGGSALSTLNAVISASGLRPTLATGTRYGTVMGSASDSMTVGPFTYNPSSFVNTLVAPTPITSIYGGDYTAELAVTAITRLTMEGTDAYSDLLGISTSQPLDGSNLNVPCFDPNNFWNDC